MSESYKIAIITRTYPPRSGGIAAAHFNLAQCLQQQHQVEVFAFDDDGDAESEEVDVVRARTAGWLAKFMKWLARRWVNHYAKGESAANCERIFSIAPAVLKFNKAIRSFQPDFILCPDNYVPALALKKPKASKMIWIAHNNYSRFEGNPVATGYSWIDLQLAHRLEMRAFGKADALVAVSEYMSDVVQDTLKSDCPVAVIENYVDRDYLGSVEASSLSDKMGVSADTRIVHVPSGGTKIKGERYTFELIRRLGREENIAFFISGPINRLLEFELDNLSRDISVYTPGQQSYDVNMSDVAACDLTVSPTLIENLSSAIIESLALGIPVISFHVGGNRELISNGKNGILVPYLDIEALIDSATELLQDEHKLNTMKSAAKLSVDAISNPKRVLSGYNSLFSTLSGR